MVYPKYPDTFWSFKYALRFLSKKALHPPLGLLTVAAMLPGSWEKKLVDMNVSGLQDKDLDWADYVFISAMSVQQDSANEVLARCREAGVKVVAGGPLFTAGHEDFEPVDHFLLGEAEVTLPRFLADLENGRPEHLYRAESFPAIDGTPIPLWELVNMKRYLSMTIQYSRGCPFNCEFCDITVLYGRTSRTKAVEQVVAELEALHRQGWRDGVLFVDDNFIGNKKKLKTVVLPAIIEWMKKKKYPFAFSTEASINLADDEELMELMARAGFDSVFVGIESPNDDSLTECNKYHNKNRNLEDSVKKIQSYGLQVHGGFIVGFDNDPPSIFERQIEFIQNTKIITAMVGLLNAPRGTQLYQRLKLEGRLLGDITGNNTDLSMNFIPKMNYDALIEGYKKIINGIYSPRPYYARVKTFLQEYTVWERGSYRFHYHYLKALIQSIILLGLKDRNRIYYWKLFFWALFRRPSVFPLAITYAICGFHFRKVFEHHL